MDKHKPVSFGVLGAARIAREKVIPAMQLGKMTRIDAIGSRDLAKAKDAAGKLGIPRAYGSYDELLADPAIEAIYNPLPNHLHVPLTIKALEAGKHVLCEKPIALTASEAALLIDAEKRSGRRVTEAFATRHHPQWLRARQIAISGEIGDVRLLQMVFTYTNVDPANVRNQADIGGGGLYDIGCYPISAARQIYASEPEKVIATFDFDPTFGTDRLASGILVFPGNRQLLFTSATQLAPHQRAMILGTKGRIELPVPFNAPPDHTIELIVDDCRDLFGGGRRVEQFAPVNQYTLQGDAFARAIRGTGPLAFPIADAVLNMRIIDALFRSGKSGVWEKP